MRLGAGVDGVLPCLFLVGLAVDVDQQALRVHFVLQISEALNLASTMRCMVSSKLMLPLFDVVYDDDFPWWGEVEFGVAI